jgi:hypothetical protein
VPGSEKEIILASSTFSSSSSSAAKKPIIIRRDSIQEHADGLHLQYHSVALRRESSALSEKARG